MSKKIDLQEQATKLGIPTSGTIKELEAAIIIAQSKQGSKESKDQKPGPLKEALKQPQEIPPLKLPLEAANNFINIINIVLPNDQRAQTLITHFSNMITKSNPELVTENSQTTPVPTQDTDSKQPNKK